MPHEKLLNIFRLMMEATQKAISIEIIEQTSRLQEENRTLRDQVNIALKSVSNLQVQLFSFLDFAQLTYLRKLIGNP